MSRWLCPQAPWIQCVADGCEYLAEPGEEIITADLSTVTPTSGDIVMAPHLLDDEQLLRFNRPGISFYETENLLCQENRWRQASEHVRSITSVPWFNYSAANSKVFGDTPRPLNPSTQIRSTTAKTLGVLFIGSLNPRRSMILSVLEAYGVSVTTIGLHNPLFMPELGAVLQRTKVLLNIHYYMPGVFESFRCIPAINSGCEVISEVSEGNEGSEWCTCVRYDNLVSAVISKLS